MKELLFRISKKDFIIDWFSGTGGGGQHRNKHQNCCRLTHIETGITKTGQRQRSRLQNQRDALMSIVNSNEFQKWHKIKCSEKLKDKINIEEEVNKMMNQKIKYEVKINGKWVEVDLDFFESECENNDY